MIVKTREMTVAEYFALDEASEIRHEYIDGEIIPMPGGTTFHNILVGTVTGLLFEATRGRDCAIYGSQMRVRIDATNYVYPDVSVVCGRQETEDDRHIALLNPTMVVEVTSDSSLGYDHSEKLDFYSAVPSIEGYLILDQERVFADWHRRVDGRWRHRQFSHINDVIRLEPLGVDLPLAQVYSRVRLPD